MNDEGTSVFSPNLKILGQIKTPDDLEIHCEIEGPVEAKNVVIAERGFVRGLVRANRLVVAGGLDGNFLGMEVEVRASGRINGDVVCKSMTIDKNGVINGKCIMSDVIDTAAARPFEDGESRNLIKPIFANRKRRRGKAGLFLRPEDDAASGDDRPESNEA